MIQQAAITDAKPITKPRNNQTLAPRGPIQPPEYASPRTCIYQLINTNSISGKY